VLEMNVDEHALLFTGTVFKSGENCFNNSKLKTILLLCSTFDIQTND